jgi:hypothetical protein
VVIRTSSEANADKMGDEECKTNTDRCDESGTMFLSGEHENGEYQERGQEHLNEQATDDRRVDVQACLDMQFLQDRTRLAWLLIFASCQAEQLT